MQWIQEIPTWACWLIFGVFWLGSGVVGGGLYFAALIRQKGRTSLVVADMYGHLTEFFWFGVTFPEPIVLLAFFIQPYFNHRPPYAGFLLPGKRARKEAGAIQTKSYWRERIPPKTAE